MFKEPLNPMIIGPGQKLRRPRALILFIVGVVLAASKYCLGPAEIRPGPDSKKFLGF